jgi:hypothetical protein
MNLSDLMTSTLVRNSSPLVQKELLLHLTSEEKQRVESAPSTHKNLADGIQTPLEQLSKIHFSWHAAFLRTLTERDVKLFLSSLPYSHALNLKKTLLFSGQLESLTHLAKTFLQEMLLKEIHKNETILPYEALPSSPLNQLLELSISDLQNLTDFLGLHDLNVEMRYIIETSKLKQITAALTQNELNYLKLLMQQPEPVPFPRMGLAGWRGDPSYLRQLLRSRGMNRLAKGVHGQDPSFIWHLIRRLDVDRATTFSKLSTSMDSETILNILTAQILQLLSFIRKPL